MKRHTEVVLVKAVKALGVEGTVVNVRPGFARNYLIPQGLAVAATSRAVQIMAERQQQRTQRLVRAKDQAQALQRKLEARSLTLKLTLGEHDQPFGSISAHDILEALRQEGLELDKGALDLEHPIKALGIYEIPVRLHQDVTATLKVWVVKA